MTTVSAWGAPTAGAALVPMTIERREPGPHDVVLAIDYCGVCHSDIHQARDEWSGANFPLVPGHEVVGHVTAVGSEVTRFAVGDRVGVGCLVDSCRQCAQCHDGSEQFCEVRTVWTYNSTGFDGVVTQGGYSGQMVVDEAYVLRVPEALDPAAAAPLLCAGITTWSPLRQWQCGPGQRVGVVGLGGLGHMAVKLARSLGAAVTVLSSSPHKRPDAAALGAETFVCTRDPEACAAAAGQLDLIINTVSAQHDYGQYLQMLRPRGTMVVVGIPPEPSAVGAFDLIRGNRRLAGSLIGGIAQTQEMLDHCAQHGITADVELIAPEQLNAAWERVVASDVRYRFVVDCRSLAAG